jgi:hypothetical protein
MDTFEVLRDIVDRRRVACYVTSRQRASVFGRTSDLFWQALGCTRGSHGSILAVSIADVDHRSYVVG